MNPAAFNALKAVYTSKSRMLSEMSGGVIGEHRGSAMEMLLCPQPTQVRLHTTKVFMFQ